MAKLDRRQVLGGTLSAGAVVVGSGVLGFPRPAIAQGKPEKITIVSHRVHRGTSTDGKGGDITKAWREKHGVELEWVTLDLNGIHDRAFREASLGNTEVGICFVLNARAVPEVIGLFEPLDDLNGANPVEDIGDISQGMLDAYRLEGKLHGIPFRQAVNAFHYNTALMEEAGLSGPPKVIEEFRDAAAKLTFTRSDGMKVHGWGFQADNYSDHVRLARAFGGDLVNEQYECLADGEGMIKALELTRDMFAEGMIPQTITAMKQADVITAMQTGQVAMSVFPFGRTVLFNREGESKFPGAFELDLPLASQAMVDRGEVLSTAEFWGMMIPKNYAHKELAWSLIQEMSTKENTVRAALNGNGPVRPSAYSDDRIRSGLSYAELEARALQHARVPMPAFSDAAKAKDIFIEEMQASLLGLKSPADAGADMASRIRPLLPS